MTGFKSPASDPDVPYCFGARYDYRDSECLACHVASECQTRTAFWAQRQSVAEMLAEQEVVLQEAVQPSCSPEKVFSQLSREFFGRPVTRMRDANRTALARTYAMCLREDIDFPTYVAGNMWALRAFIEDKGFPFQATMLSGEKAMTRYHAYMKHRSRKYRAGCHHSSERESLMGEFRRNLYTGEHAVAEEYVSWFVFCGEHAWDRAVRRVRPNRTWKDAATRRGKWHAACEAFGKDRARQEKDFATLRAAAAVLESYAHGLSYRVSAQLGEHLWPRLAELIARLFPTQRRDYVSLPEISGTQWP